MTVANCVLIIAPMAWPHVPILCKLMNTKHVPLFEECPGRVARALLRGRLLNHSLLENEWPQTSYVFQSQICCVWNGHSFSLPRDRISCVKENIWKWSVNLGSYLDCKSVFFLPIPIRMCYCTKEASVDKFIVRILPIVPSVQLKLCWAKAPKSVSGQFWK